MSKIVKFVADLGEFKAGEVLEVEDQIALDAIVQGSAVPSIEHFEKIATAALEQAPEVVAAEQAPEIA